MSENHFTKANARKTMESQVVDALWKTVSFHGLTIDKCGQLVTKVIDELFAPHVRWAVKVYLEAVENE